MEHMSTAATLQMHTTSSEDTVALGVSIGRALKGGEVIELMSDLGGGKTTLTRGIAAGMGSSDKVASPTFTLSREYKSGKLRLVHYDFYRLHDPGILEFELAESVNDPSTVTVIEWADIVQDVLPAKRLSISIKTTADDERDITITADSSLEYLLPTTP